MSVAQLTVVAELSALRRRMPDLGGCVLGTLDGLLVAHDWPHAAPDAMAALAATHVGLARRFMETAGIGAPQETLVEGLHGCVATYPVSSDLVLIVLGHGKVNLALMHLECRRASALLGTLAETGKIPRPLSLDLPVHPTAADGGLVQRLPMATLDADGSLHPAR